MNGRHLFLKQLIFALVIAILFVILRVHFVDLATISLHDVLFRWTLSPPIVLTFHQPILTTTVSLLLFLFRMTFFLLPMTSFGLYAFCWGGYR